jgi:hypothetical protein
MGDQDRVRSVIPHIGRDVTVRWNPRRGPADGDQILAGQLKSVAFVPGGQLIIVISKEEALLDTALPLSQVRSIEPNRRGDQ